MVAVETADVGLEDVGSDVGRSAEGDGLGLVQAEVVVELVPGRDGGEGLITDDERAHLGAGADAEVRVHGLDQVGDDEAEDLVPQMLQHLVVRRRVVGAVLEHVRRPGEERAVGENALAEGGVVDAG